MGNANPAAAVAGMGAKNSANNAAKQAQDGLSSLTGAKTEEQQVQHKRAVDRNAAFEQKKREREERKKKLTSQWADNKKG